jgi:uncharacterized OB-fold protein
MPKQSPVADDIDRPFWEACNEERLVIQHCAACDRLQHPPQPACFQCGSSEQLGWKPVRGRGTIYSYGVVYDTPVAAMQPDQPYNLAVVQLDDDPGINMYSHLPGAPIDNVPIGAAVELVFETTPGNGQKVPEWRLVG